MEMGIEYHRIRIATPRHNGKVERQHRIDEQRFYKQIRNIVFASQQTYYGYDVKHQNYYIAYICTYRCAVYVKKLSADKNIVYQNL